MAKSGNFELSRTNWIFALVGVAVFFVPLILVKLHAENELVRLVLGGWRIVIFWGITIPAIYFLEKKINAKS